MCLFIVLFILILIFLETEGQEANAKAQEAVDHLANSMSSREEILQLRIELPTSSFRFGYLSTIIQQLRVVSDQFPT